MKDQPYRDQIGRQYERWLYPKPVQYLDLPLFEEAKIKTFLYWPQQKNRENLDVLVAGCGTREAALVAYHNRTMSVVGIDISSNSLKHEEYLKKEYQLDNLSLHRLAVENVAQLDCDFDLIFSHGVLHHLHDPDEGVRALKSVLRKDGVMSLMIYGAFGRAGIRMLQMLFQTLSLEQSPIDIQVVRATIDILSHQHPAMNYIAAYQFAHDSVFVDTFLNKRDIDYSVENCLELLRTCGLAFQGWVNNELYYPNAHIPKNHPLYARINALPEQEIWKAMEPFHAINQHYFLACGHKRSQGDYRIDFDGDDFLRYVPVINRSRLKGYGVGILDTFDVLETQLFRHLDGNNTIAVCLERSGFQGDSPRLEAAARRYMKDLWRKGLVHVIIPE